MKSVKPENQSDRFDRMTAPYMRNTLTAEKDIAALRELEGEVDGDALSAYIVAIREKEARYRKRQERERIHSLNNFMVDRNIMDRLN